jgi:hypothetical protein
VAVSRRTEVGVATVCVIAAVWVTVAIVTKPSFPPCQGGVNDAVGRTLHEDHGFSFNAVSFPVGDRVWLIGFPSELVSTYPDVIAWVTDMDPVTGRGGGHYLSANENAARQIDDFGLDLRRSDATQALVAAFPDQDAVNYVRECVEERAQLSLS